MAKIVYRLGTVLTLLNSALTSSIQTDTLVYASAEAQAANLPLVQLPDATYQAQSYDKKNDLYTFKNIRFGAPPIGSLRWAKPQQPGVNTTLQTGDYGPACLQGDPTTVIAPTIGRVLGYLFGNVGALVNVGEIASGAKALSEDCLFLDILVRGKALRGEAKLPAVNWIFGGAYLIGSKEGMYDGTPIVTASNSDVIYVAANYRLAAWGFLAGASVEKDGTPNAGLWDQRAALQWIQDNGALFGADIENVSVWSCRGESAGAGSITHHLVAFGGKGASLFKRAVIQSPAFDPQFDRSGALERQFQSFASSASCSDLACLRQADVETIQEASGTYTKSLPGGNPGWGPAVDGDLVQQEPGLELPAGNVVSGNESIINSHVADEAALFTPAETTETTIDTVLGLFFAAFPSVVQKIKDHYSAISSDPYTKLKAIYQTMIFVCHIRYISEAFPGKTYNLQYGRGSGYHGTDLAADFYDPSNILSLYTLLHLGDNGYDLFAKPFQHYLLRHAQTGNPNTLRDSGTIEWPLVKMGPTLGNVMNASDTGYALFDDPVTTSGECDFCKDMLTEATQDLSV